MNKLYNRIICALLCLSVTAVVGCGDNGKPSDTDKSTVTTDSSDESQGETELVPDLPAYDGKGRDFTILAKMEGNMSGRWTALDVYAEEANGEIVNDAVYNRNLALESKYNIGIKADYMDIGSQYSYSMYKEISKLVMANDNTYDIIMPSIQDAALLARDKMVYDLASLDNIDLTKPWWSQQFNKDVNIGGKSYYANGDICMSFIRASYCILFNKGIIEDYSLENPYDIVDSGKWTMDKMMEMAAAFGGDVNNDGKYDAYDNVGLAVLNNHIEPMFTSAGCKLVTYNENDGFTFTGGTERCINVLTMIEKIYESDGVTLHFYNPKNYTSAMNGMDQVNAAATAFESGTVLFLAGTMNNVPSMRNMETDFGILPFPKYDEDQDNYYTYIQSWASGCVAIPISCSDVDATSIILEDMAYYSNKYITPAYYDTALVNKYARDNESQKMLELICNTRTCDIGNLFNVGTLMSTITTNINNNTMNGGFSSLIASKESQIKTTLDEITELYLN
ncbi:MAG: extracellular solute-binding protein [Clostridiales bacterium]|nr:extracellular solute-binding protein [Clostridiales bacterium]